jgi:ketosteroid isomerase-like protein
MDRASILKDVAPPKPDEPVQTYGAEDIVVHQNGDVAILNFRLVVNTDDKGKKTTQYYRNTGTFQQRSGQWKVIAWQATPIVEKGEASK